jgi:hypothetical protein
MAEEQPITPHAAPSLDPAGQLTYSGDDGRRYVVGLPPDSEAAEMERVLADLQLGKTLLQQIEALCHQWISAVHSPELDARAALVLLLTSLETNLEQTYPELD